MLAPIECIRSYFVPKSPVETSIERHLAIIRSLARPSRLWYRFFSGTRSQKELMQHGKAAVHPVLDLIEELEAFPPHHADDVPAIQYPFWVPYFIAFGPLTASVQAQVHLFDVLERIGFGDASVERRLRDMLKTTCENNERRVNACRREDVAVSAEYKWSLTPFCICELLIALFPEYSPHASGGWKWPSKNIDDVLTDWKQFVAMPLLHAEKKTDASDEAGAGHE